MSEKCCFVFNFAPFDDVGNDIVLGLERGRSFFESYGYLFGNFYDLILMNRQWVQFYWISCFWLNYK